MKIASVYPFRAYPPKGGNHVHAYQLIRRFQAEGHDVLTWGDDSVPGVRSFDRTAEGLRALESEADVLYVRLDANQMHKDVELVALHERAAKPVVWEINSPANEDLAFSYLGADRSDSSSIPALFDRLKRRFHAYRKIRGINAEERARRQLAPCVSAALCVSECVSNYAREGLGVRVVHTLPNGADHETHRPEGPIAPLPFPVDGALTVLYAGSPIYPWQGLDVLQRTIELCEQAGDRIRFVLLMNQESQRPITSANTVTKVRVPHQQVGDYLRAVDCAVVIHPEFFWSRWGSHGSPMKLFDYMACGRPVVASRVGQLAEVIETGRNGVLFDNTAGDLRRALVELSQHKYDMAAMGRAARADVEATYNWHVIGRRTLDVLEQARSEARHTESPRSANGILSQA